MGETTGIQWCEKTWNPIQGCHKISKGCQNCYMFAEKTRYGQNPNVVIRSADATFYAPLKKWKEPSLIFTCSWSDWFIEEADQWRDDMWDVIRRTPQHTYQILTKRADRIAAHLPADWGDGWPNVWLGVSVENQEQDWRIRELLKVPARIHFLSLEPLLGEIKWICAPDERPQPRFIGTDHEWHPKGAIDTAIDWVIVGGESGIGARPCDLGWIDSIVRQCESARVPCFVKQIGSVPQVTDNQGQVRTWKPKDKKGGSVEDLVSFSRQMPRLAVGA